MTGEPESGSGRGLFWFLAAAVLLLATFVGWERRAPAPLLDLALLRGRCGALVCPRSDPSLIAAGYAAIDGGVFAARPARDGLNTAADAGRPSSHLPGGIA